VSRGQALGSRTDSPEAGGRRLDHVEFGLKQSKFKNVIVSKSLSGLRAENRFALFRGPALGRVDIHLKARVVLAA
jgi:hypothetical protein